MSDFSDALHSQQGREMGKHPNGLSHQQVDELNKARLACLRSLKEQLSKGKNAEVAGISKFLTKEVDQFTSKEDLSGLQALLEDSTSTIRYAVAPASISGSYNRRRSVGVVY